MPSSFIRRIPVLGALVAGLAFASCDLEHAGGPAAPQDAPANVGTNPPGPVETYGCLLPRGAGNGVGCPREGPSFQDQVDQAIDKVRNDHEDWFDGLQVRDGRVGNYVDEVVENLRRRGLCAFNDGEEIAVKNSNDFSDQYDIITSNGRIWSGYMATCRPAWSEIPPAGNNS